jgi:hypothetical protein
MLPKKIPGRVSIDAPKEDPWTRLRGALKDVFAELGGGEQYLRAEREHFYLSRQSK